MTILIKSILLQQMRHILDVASLTEKAVHTIFLKALQYKHLSRPSPIAKTNTVISTMFFEHSTHTQMSFQTAAYRLGANVLNYDQTTSSEQPRETIEDTVTTMSQYADVLVIRHPRQGIFNYLSKYSTVPIINAGDGTGEHPTQALLDVFTMQPYIDKRPRTVITFAGDLKNSRAVHSTLTLLDKLYNNLEFHLVQENELSLDYWYTMNLRNPCYEHTELDHTIENSDILYMTRVQTENIDETRYLPKSKNVLTKSLLDKSKPNMIVLHPLPRTYELPTEIDNDPKCKFVEQMRNGICVRMAILDYVLTNPRSNP